MVSFLFWNLNKRPLQDRIARLALAHGIDVLMLAECETPVDVLLEALNQPNGSHYCLPFSEAQKIRILTSFPEASLRAVFDDPGRRLTVRRLIVGKRIDILLAVIHFHSKVNWSAASQDQACGTLAQDIAKAEKQVRHMRTVLVGDFNMNPFEPGVVGANGLHAVMTRAVARAGIRTVGARDYPFFYNPMWGCFGDRTNGPPGTHYYRRAEPVLYFWNIFDQVLLRPDLMDSLRDLQILDAEGDTSLLSLHGLPDKSVGSDHLPILFRLEL